MLTKSCNQLVSALVCWVSHSSEERKLRVSHCSSWTMCVHDAAVM